MRWREWPNWLKGGIIGVLFFIPYILTLISMLFFYPQPDWIIMLQGIYQLLIPNFLISLSKIMRNLYLYWLSILLEGFIIGTIIGWAYGKIRSH